MKKARKILCCLLFLVGVVLTSCQNKESVTEDGLRGVYVTDLSSLKSVVEENVEYGEMGEFGDFASALVSMTLSNVELSFQFKENDVFVMNVAGGTNLISAMVAASMGENLPLVAEYRMENDSLLSLRSLDDISAEFKPYAIVRKLGDYEYLRLKIIANEDEKLQNISFTLKRIEAEPVQ